MLIEFSVSNYGSFDHLQTLSFKATKLESSSAEVEVSNIIVRGENRYLKLCGLYGANASGKSNFIRALGVFKEMVVSSVVAEGYSASAVNPFRQSIDGVKRPSFFQIILLLSGKRYRYGFTLKANGGIASEWLFGPADKNETYYFKRTGENIQSNSEWFPEGYSLPEDNLRPDALFLSFCSSYNGQISKEIRGFLHRQVALDAKIRTSRKIRIMVGSRYQSTNQLIDNGEKGMVLNWFKEVGLPYTGIRIMKEDGYLESVLLSKNIFDDEGNIVGQTEMDLNRDESEGTIKFYSYIGRLYKKFTEGGLYVVDEIDSNFHPSLLQKIIKLFQNKNINKANAQLLFTSHDTNLMDPMIMRRDQFYFAEKTVYESTKLYSLADLKGIRNNTDFARQYLAGLYGALPILGDYLEDDSFNLNQDVQEI
jgi:AAA15 family ATPase/GTPase